MIDLVRVINDPAYDRWRSMVASTGGCAHPIHLAGESTVVDTTTGEVLHSYTTADEPSGHLLVACGNRRASVCPACSRVYQADAFQLIRAGLSGGKGVPDTVSTHPRAFVTLTAPSFGPVHTRRERGGTVRACRPRARDKLCPHGDPVGCHARHEEGDDRLGQPLCAECYDYTGAVLWQAHAGALWHRFTLEVRRTLAAEAGLSRREFGRRVRVSFAEVAEYHRRGLVHFHAVVRLDGPGGGAEPPPDWADHDLLTRAIAPAVRRVRVTSPHSGLGRWDLVWGDQLDIRPILLDPDAAGLSERAVASYIAKYATKGAEASGTVYHRLSCPACKGRGRLGLAASCGRCRGTGLKPGLHLDALPVTEHARRMIRTCWELGARPEFTALRLRPWAHMLGFRGHFSSKSQRYSTTFGDLRDLRARYRAAEARERHGLPALDDATTLTLGHWRFAGTGYTPGEAVLAEHIRQRVFLARAIAAEREDG
ncbi:replication initiator [Planomonospora parontospora]|uniref:replication initiator n=1 Tax=Planomonospora parontospora TaxID=58119 RepID=UPI00167111DC|nr:replication initiator [Planomonospora parontospora]GGL19155.1 plasmid replication initiator protein [Planomonospora parontospora subsp. antibiotica]GII15466.1 plasmid replication initiator protein [Planomonospora parontospora subsp. antibiotica]